MLNQKMALKLLS